MTPERRLAWIAVALVAAGCANTARAVGERYAREYGCPRESVAVEDLSSRGYRATGCGPTSLYVASCSGFGCFAPIIVEQRSTVSITTSPAPAPARTTGAWPNTAVHAMVDSINDDVVACFVAEHLPATVRVIIGRTGQTTDGSLVSEATPDEFRCVHGVLGRVHVDGAYPPRSVTLSFAPRRQDITPSSGGEAPSQESDDAEWDVESALRDAVDAHASTILACTSNAPVAIALSWTADGSLSITLRGAMHGAPEEGCVARALTDVHVAATGHAGTILHPVQPD